MQDDDSNPILDEAQEKMDIVPYTKRDRIVTYCILLLVFMNFLTLMLTVPWGTLF
jgi:hypothetical protein